MARNKVKPTKKQTIAFQHIMAGKTKQEAMLAAGYSAISSQNPKLNLMGRAGVETLMDQYRGELKKAGVGIEVLAEVEAAGLFDDNAAVRLGYLKENKKSLGLSVDEPIQSNTQVNFIFGRGENNETDNS